MPEHVLRDIVNLRGKARQHWRKRPAWMIINVLEKTSSVQEIVSCLGIDCMHMFVLGQH